MITILGPTATGKTRIAAILAGRIGGEIISADSRQVYQGMDLGTGKDYGDYTVGEKEIPYHLIDIVKPGYEYNIYEYQRDFLNAYYEIIKKDSTPILCGGSGLYLEAVLLGYDLFQVPFNSLLREELESRTDKELAELLASKKKLHNITDTSSRERLIKAIEISVYYEENPEKKNNSFPEIPGHVFGIKLDRELQRQRITERLKIRLDEGMIDEVKKLLRGGLKPEQLIFYGLEYKYLTLYISGKISYEDMFTKLNTAIHQFSKRQMTWFRRMEKRGIRIHWIEGMLPAEEKVGIIVQMLETGG